MKWIDLLMLGTHSFLQPAILALMCIWILWEMNSMSLILKDPELASRFAQTWSAANFLLTFPSKSRAMRKGENFYGWHLVCVFCIRSINWIFVFIYCQKVWVSSKNVLKWISSGNTTWARKNLWILTKTM